MLPLLTHLKRKKKRNPDLKKSLPAVILFASCYPEIHDDLSQISEFHSSIKQGFRMTCLLKSVTKLIYFIDFPVQIPLLMLSCFGDYLSILPSLFSGTP